MTPFESIIVTVAVYFVIIFTMGVALVLTCLRDIHRAIVLNATPREHKDAE